MSPALTAAALAAVLGWLWFLARGRAPGGVKRLALRVSLLGLVFVLVWGAQRRGLFARSSGGFELAMLLAVITVTVGYLYLTRFCGECGRMVRNLKVDQCPRCGATLPRHGMTSRPRGASRVPPLGLRPTDRHDGPEA